MKTALHYVEHKVPVKYFIKTALKAAIQLEMGCRTKLYFSCLKKMLLWHHLSPDIQLFKIKNMCSFPKQSLDQTLKIDGTETDWTIWSVINKANLENLKFSNITLATCYRKIFCILLFITSILHTGAYCKCKWKKMHSKPKSLMARVTENLKTDAHGS